MPTSGSTWMPELRVDPLTGLRSIVAADRATRPGGGWNVAPPAPIDPETDPFLEGHEDRTPPEVHAVRANGGAPDPPRRARPAGPHPFPPPPPPARPPGRPAPAGPPPPPPPPRGAGGAPPPGAPALVHRAAAAGGAGGGGQRAGAGGPARGAGGRGGARGGGRVAPAHPPPRAPPL